MKIFIDANILISAFLSPKGTPAKVLTKAVNEGHKLLTSEYVLSEVTRLKNFRADKKVS